MASIINASPTNGIVQTADGSGVLKCQANGVTTNALAWVNFDGTLTGSISPRAAYNVSSVTRNSTGNYTVNFTNALADKNYIVCGNAGAGGTYQAVTVNPYPYATQTTSTMQFRTFGSATTLADEDLITIAIFGN